MPCICHFKSIKCRLHFDNTLTIYQGSSSFNAYSWPYSQCFQLFIWLTKDVTFFKNMRTIILCLMYLLLYCSDNNYSIVFHSSLWPFIPLLSRPWCNSKSFSYLLASENPVTCVSIGNFTINDRYPFHSPDLNTIFPYSLKNISSNWSFENLVPNHPFAWHYIDNAWRKS